MAGANLSLIPRFRLSGAFGLSLVPAVVAVGLD